jgi:hypothetical protein
MAKNIKLTENNAKKSPQGGVLVGKKDGQTIIYDDGKVGGWFVGKTHKEGGIQGIDKTSGQPIEVQTGEVIITAPALADQTPRNFQGKMMTNRQILSKINSDAGGVAFAEDGMEIPSKILCNGGSYKYGGKMMSDKEIADEINKCGCEHEKSKFEGGGDLKKVPLRTINKIKKLSDRIVQIEKINLGNDIYSYNGDLSFKERNKLINEQEKLQNELTELTNELSQEQCFSINSDSFKDLNTAGDYGYEKEYINGGHLSEGMSLEDIAKKHGVTLEELDKQVEIGMEDESIHAGDYKDHFNIVKDHLVESPTFYTDEQNAQGENERFDVGGDINKIVLTKEFKKWFDGSKVVDKKGNPLIVYHGSPDLRGLKNEYVFKTTDEKYGLIDKSRAYFFTDSYNIAKSYADPHRAFDYQNAEEGIILLYLSLKKPLIVDAENQIWRKFETEINEEKIVGTKNLISYAQSKDYDGVIVKNVRDYYTSNESKKNGGNVYVAFNPNQIKLADGTNTTFYKYNDDIRFVNGGDIKSLYENENDYIKYLVEWNLIDGVESYKLNKYLKSKNLDVVGLLPDNIKKDPEYIKIKRDYDLAFARLRQMPIYKYPKNRDRVQEQKDRKIAQSIIDKIIQIKLKKEKFVKGGEMKKENLVKDAKDGNTPARDLNNYNDMLDVQADGQVGADTGIYIDGGNVGKKEKSFESEGSTEGKGKLYEFFTPQVVADKMLALAQHYGFKGGNVLEPATGSGRLIKNLKDSNITAFEISKDNFEILKREFPNAELYNFNFEKAFLKEPRFNTLLNRKGTETWLKNAPFDLVIANPPYGKFSGLYSSYFKFKGQVEHFFILQTLHLLKKGGLGVYLIPSSFMRNGIAYNDIKKEIFEIAELVDAYRLPSNIFEKTQIGTDILILRKK